MSAPPPPAPNSIPPNVAELTAPIIFGTLFNWALFGVLCVQIYVYSRSFFKSDKAWVKSLVYTVFLIEVAQTAMTGADMYFWFAAGFGNLPGLSSSHLSAIDIPFFAALISLMVQLFFAYRIHTIRNTFWPVVVLIVTLSLLQTSGAFYNAIKGFINPNLADSKSHGDLIALGLWVGCGATVDVLIAAVMTFLLLGSRRQEHSASFDVLTRIVRLTIETNTMTAVVSIVTIAMEYGYNKTPYFFAPTAVLGKLYSNTLLVTLNNRLELREVQMRLPAKSCERNQGGSSAEHITVSTKVETLTDMGSEPCEHVTLNIRKLDA